MKSYEVETNEDFLRKRTCVYVDFIISMFNNK